MHFKLNYIDDSFIIITPPPAAKGKLIEIYNNELRKAIADENVWMFDKDISGEEDIKRLEVLEFKMFTKFRAYYQAIAAFFDLEVDKLIAIDRYYFFLCTKPIEVGEGKWHRGLSYLETLLGYNYSSEEQESDIDFVTTGNQYLDIITATLLNFKVAGLEERFSIFELVKMNKYASESAEEMEKKMDKGKAKQNYKFTSNVVKEEELDKDFVDNQDQIFSELNGLGILPPS